MAARSVLLSDQLIDTDLGGAYSRDSIQGAPWDQHTWHREARELLLTLGSRNGFDYSNDLSSPVGGPIEHASSW